MPLQPTNVRFRRMVTGFYAWAGAMVVAALAPLGARSLIHTGTLPGRLAGVALGTAAWVPLAVVIVVMIRACDEYERRIHLVALAMAFAGALALLTLLDWLARARFIRPPALGVVLLGVAALWFVSIVLVKRHFERHP